MKVLYFGTYDRAAPRNSQVVSCLRGAGVEVLERHRDVWGVQNWSLGLRQMSRVLKAERSLARDEEREADVVLVGYPGHFDLPAARRTARGRPVVFNPLVSLSDTLVADRGRFRDGSLPARTLARIDRRALRGADLVVADTRANAEHLAELAELPPHKIEVCFVGAEERLFEPGWAPEEPFTALFVGKLIPLHGLETILAAARAAPDLQFRIVGSGQLEDLIRERPANVEWVPWVEYERLPAELHRAGCALGIFGISDKAMRVIPNKAFQALACGTPLLTADTPAARELLVHDESALLVPAGEPEALAAALRTLRADPELAQRLGRGGRVTYEALASEQALGARWRGLFERALENA